MYPEQRVAEAPSMATPDNVTKDPSEAIEPRDVRSPKELERFFRDMKPIFDGRESEQNWPKRYENLTLLRRLTKGNAPSQFPSAYIAGIRSMIDGILNTLNSLRTVLSNLGCLFVQELARACGPLIDGQLEIIMQGLMKVCAAMKKITAQNGNTTAHAVIENVSYTPRLLFYVNAACNERNANLRIFGAEWLMVFITTHGSRHKASIEHAGGLETLMNCICKGLSDADGHVRGTMRSTFWSFHAVWPSKSSSIMSKIDQKTRKALEDHPANPKDNAPMLQGPSSPPKRPAGRSALKDAISATKKANMNRSGAKSAPPSRPESRVESKPARSESRAESRQEPLMTSTSENIRGPDKATLSATKKANLAAAVSKPPSRSESRAESKPSRSESRAESKHDLENMSGPDKATLRAPAVRLPPKRSAPTQKTPAPSTSSTSSSSFTSGPVRPKKFVLGGGKHASSDDGAPPVAAYNQEESHRDNGTSPATISSHEESHRDDRTPPATVYSQEESYRHDRAPPTAVYSQEESDHNDGAPPAAVYSHEESHPADETPPAAVYTQEESHHDDREPPAAVYSQEENHVDDRMPPAAEYSQESHLDNGAPPDAAYSQEESHRVDETPSAVVYSQESHHDDGTPAPVYSQEDGHRDDRVTPPAVYSQKESLSGDVSDPDDILLNTIRQLQSPPDEQDRSATKAELWGNLDALIDLLEKNDSLAPHYPLVLNTVLQARKFYVSLFWHHIAWLLENVMEIVTDRGEPNVLIPLVMDCIATEEESEKTNKTIAMGLQALQRLYRSPQSGNLEKLGPILGRLMTARSTDIRLPAAELCVQLMKVFDEKEVWKYIPESKKNIVHYALETDRRNEH